MLFPSEERRHGRAHAFHAQFPRHGHMSRMFAQNAHGQMVFAAQARERVLNHGIQFFQREYRVHFPQERQRQFFREGIGRGDFQIARGESRLARIGRRDAAHGNAQPAFSIQPVARIAGKFCGQRFLLRHEPFLGGIGQAGEDHPLFALGKAAHAPRRGRRFRRHARAAMAHARGGPQDHWPLPFFGAGERVLGHLIGLFRRLRIEHRDARIAAKMPRILLGL